MTGQRVICQLCGLPPHPDEPVVNNLGAHVWAHFDCYLKRQMARRPGAVLARLKEILGAEMVLH